jgi:DNA-binding MarR family transcriptional regulator
LTCSKSMCIYTYMNNNQTNYEDMLNMNLCTCANIRKAARVVTQMYDTALQETGLKSGQLSLLATLSKQGELPVTVLADILVMDRTTLTRNLKPLVRDGLINITTEEDQRVRVVGLSKKGVKQFDDAYPLWVKVQSQMVDGIGLDRWSAFVEDLNAAVDVARKA